MIKLITQYNDKADRPSALYRWWDNADRPWLMHTILESGSAITLAPAINTKYKYDYKTWQRDRHCTDFRLEFIYD